MKSAIIYPTGEVVLVDDPAIDAQDKRFKFLQEQVHHFECVDLPFQCTGYVDEDGLMKGLPLNLLASVLYQKAKLNNSLHICGTMVVFGHVDQAGDETDLTQEMAQFLVAANAE